MVLKWPVPANLDITRRSLSSMGVMGQETAKKLSPEGPVLLGQETAKLKIPTRVLGQETAKKLSPEGPALGAKTTPSANQGGPGFGQETAKSNLDKEPPTTTTHLAQKPCCSKPLAPPQQQKNPPPPLAAETARINKCSNRSCQLCPHLLTANAVISKFKQEETPRVR